MKSIYRSALSYSATTLAAQLMHTVFNFYYVKVFLNHYKISDSWFYFAHTTYMLWNAVNDPVFGWLQDNSKLPCVRRRHLAILYGAPVFVLSFLLPWFSWGNDQSPPWVTGLHLIVSLWLYDAMFTYVLLAQCALFTEISYDNNDRHTVLKFNQIGSIIGSTSVFWCELISHNLQYMARFQICCVVIACLSLTFFTYTGSMIRAATSSDLSDKGDELSSNSSGSIFKLVFDLLRQRNFVCFVAINFFQIFHNTFGSNFFSIFSASLLSDGSVSSIARTFLSGSAFAVPQLLVLLTSPLLSTLGSYYLILYSFYFKLLMALGMYVAGPSYTWLLAAYFLLDRSIPEAVFSLFMMPLSHIIDEDKRLHKRSQPISSTVNFVHLWIRKRDFV
ncbi:transmembrane protein 180-like isoform X2 [Oscarella lobularis]|uniref:transmembrane protein 180-like isoform X2 n=1 Tax=Oscarella lobularis TaxID=121494 RepID=UPI0033140ACC